MQLRRMCKYNYAVITATPSCPWANYCTYTLLFQIYSDISIDSSNRYGIIVLTHYAVVKEVLMVKHDDKEKALRDCGALNAHPVTDSLFSDNDFFDPRDLVQVKYEMLRKVRKEGESVRRAAASFGFSRPSFYKNSAAFDLEGVPGLLPRKRGPQSGHKLTAEVMAFVEGFYTGEHPLSIPALLDEVEKHFGIRVHRRSLERALRKPGKKTPQGDPR